MPRKRKKDNKKKPPPPAPKKWGKPRKKPSERDDLLDFAEALAGRSDVEGADDAVLDDDEDDAVLPRREKSTFERVWIEKASPKPQVTGEARRELLHLAAIADETGDLCSTLFPLFIEGYQQDTGCEPSHAVRWFAQQIEKLQAMGVHCSSSVIATLLRELAKA